MKRVGLLGGAFNPIHIGHLVMAQVAVEKLRLDEVVFVPSFISTHNRKNMLVSPEHRFNMVKLALRGNLKFSVSDMEIKRKGVSYTIDTVKTLKEKTRKNTKYYFIIGQDNYNTLRSWKDIDELLRLVDFVVMKREDNKKNEKKIKAKFIDMPSIGFSSSFIRKNIALKKSVQYYVPEKVIQYIKENNLYSINIR